MTRLLFFAAAALLSGCASLQSATNEPSPQELELRRAQEDATRAYIEQLSARRVDSFRTYGELYLLSSNQSFVEVISAAGRFIIEVEGPCEGLIGARLQGCSSYPRRMQTMPPDPDRVFCGCEIKAIYAVDERGL